MTYFNCFGSLLSTQLSPNLKNNLAFKRVRNWHDSIEKSARFQSRKEGPSFGPKISEPNKYLTKLVGWQDYTHLRKNQLIGSLKHTRLRTRSCNEDAIYSILEPRGFKMTRLCTRWGHATRNRRACAIIRVAIIIFTISLFSIGLALN